MGAAAARVAMGSAGTMGVMMGWSAAAPVVRVPASRRDLTVVVPDIGGGSFQPGPSDVAGLAPPAGGGAPAAAADGGGPADGGGAVAAAEGAAGTIMLCVAAAFGGTAGPKPPSPGPMLGARYWS